MDGIEFSHLRLDVADLDRSVDFYRRVVGLDVVVRYDTPTHTIVQVGVGGRLPGIELWHEPRLGPPPPSLVHIAFLADDVDAAFQTAVARGAPVHLEPFTIGGERIAMVLDPDGYPVEFHNPHAGG
ncbi:VOC family protein [Rugosimonospora africana]|uniref:Lactoylglutathione lyase n=1 Tax=Rugosimonospora africana TaxID=556532 RepID=A0A8J3QJR6_9ACTN|nr:VOC family protein [Rugosimonospora africana]GIH11866.1 lactoylglutathione lyase [Rugosimonospora africana]